MLEDIEHFRAKLGKIEGASKVGDKLLELVNAKPIVAASSSEKTESAGEKQGQEEKSEPAQS